jgi:hypothetical protein
LLSCTVLAGEAQDRAAYDAARDDEYEENEVYLEQLRNWFAKVRDRDVFGSGGRQEPQQLLAECGQSLEDYAARVFTEQDESR